jgi:replicative DNA helicase
MDRNIDKRLMHLSDNDIQELIKRYYSGENIKKLIEQYKINARPSQLVGLFPPKKTLKVCPYCHENFILIYKSRSYFTQNDDYCQLCNHREGRCDCINCIEAQEKQQEKEWKAKDGTIDFTFLGSKTDTPDFSQLNIEDKINSEASTRKDRFELSGIINKFSKSGIAQLDRHFQGFMPSNLYIMSGRHSMGKTTIGLWICYYLKFKENINVAIISMEMSKNQIYKRLGFSHLCTYKSSYNKHFDQNTLKQNFKTISNSFIVRSAPQMNTDDLYQLVLKAKLNGQIDFIFIDSIHRMSLSEDDRKYAANREQEVSKIVRDLKSMAMKLKIPILAISDINRDIEYRDRRIPMIQDLKDSGTLENVADFVFFIHRPEMYGITEDENGDSLCGLVDIIIAKNRYGKTTKDSYYGVRKRAFAFEFNNLSEE